MDISLKGKTALIGGSTQGIGLAIAQELALLGANCILIARNSEKLQAVCARLPVSQGQQHSMLTADFMFPEKVAEAVNTVVAEKPIHILINNTGGPSAGAILDASVQDFESAFRQHIVVNQLLVQALVPGMKAAGYGRIVNIISTSVKIPLNNLGVSNTIRAAVAAWSKTMANELGASGITVNNILPGFTKTARLDMLINHLAENKKISTEEQSAQMANEVPAKRFGTAEEIAAVAAFLCTPAAAYVNGTSIPVDGGRTGSI